MSSYYHLSVSIISRSTGRSAVACAAYRSGQALNDERYGVLCDYSKRRGIPENGIVAPGGAPQWVHDREALWNNVESFERRKDAQLSREFVLGLPCQLTREQQKELLMEFIDCEFTSRGLVSDWAIHAPNRQGDQRNWHAHIMTTMRTMDENGFATHKDRNLNTREQIRTWREQWAEMQNERFRSLGLREPNGAILIADHRNYRDAGTDRESTLHLGVHATAIERRGIQTDIGNLNREIQRQNNLMQANHRTHTPMTADFDNSSLHTTPPM